MGKHIAIALAVLLSAGACSRSDATANGVATDDGIAAVALPDEQYRDFLKRSVLGTQSGAMSVGLLGLDEGCGVLDDAVDKTVEKNLPQWRANLVAAYRQHIPADQLAAAVERSPRRARSMLQPYLPAIGRAMQQSSEPLLASSTVEVLDVVHSAAAKADRASVDMAARQRDLERLKASGEMCGVGKWRRQ